MFFGERSLTWCIDSFKMVYRKIWIPRTFERPWPFHLASLTLHPISRPCPVIITTVSQGRRNRISFRLGKVLQATGRVEFQSGVVLHRGWGCCPQSSLYCPPSVPPCLYGLIVFSSIHQRRHAISVLWQPCHSFPNCVHTSMSGEHVRHRIPSVSTYSYSDFF